MQQRLLPPRLFQFGLVLMVALDVVFGPRPLAARGLELFAGVALACIGVALTFGAAGQFSRRKTNINTFLKPDYLVVDGLFQYSRNPMYLGFACVLMGVALALDNFVGMAIAVAFVVIADRWYIQFEEAAMAETFGEAYAVYRKSTRRWL